MSFFGGTSGMPKKGPQPLGLNARNTSTNQEARPVPWLFGRRRLGVTFISDAFDIKSVPVGSGGKAGTSSGNNYYASFAAVCCLGTARKFHDIYLNGDPVFLSQEKQKATSVKQTDNLAIFQTKNPHGFSDDQAVVIYGAKQAEFNGEYHVTVVSETQFAYTISGSTQTPAKAGGNIFVRAKLDPIAADGEDSTDITLPDYGLITIYWGTETQTADAYLNAQSGASFPAMRGICYIVFHQLFLGFNQKSVQNIEVVLEALPQPAWIDPDSVDVNGDANPSAIAYELLSNPRHGLAWSDADIDIDTLASTADVFKTEKLGLSRVIDRQDDASTLLMSLCETIGALPKIDSQGRFTWVLMRQPDDVSGITELSDDNFAEPPEVQPADWESTSSEVQMVYEDRDQFFNNQLAEWKDLASVNAADKPGPLQLDRPWVSQASIANALVKAAGTAAALPEVTGSVTLIFTDALFAALATGSIFTFADARLITGGIFRVTSRSIPDPAKAEFEIEFTIDRSYLFFGTIPAEPTAPNFEGDAPPPDEAPVNSRYVVLELPPALCMGRPALAFIAAREVQTISAAEILLAKNYDWNGSPTESFLSLGKLQQFAWRGILAADYPATTQCIDLVRGARVQLDGADMILDEVTAFDSLAGEMLALIGDEILSVIRAELLGTGFYRLRLIRGKYGTPILSHSEADQVLIFRRSSIVPLIHPIFEQPGTVARFKLIFGDEQTAEADAFDFGIRGLAWSVPAPAALTVNGRFENAWYRGRINLQWSAPDAGAILPRADVVRKFTKIEFVKDDAVIATRTTVAESLSLKWNEISGDPAASFTIRAGSVVTVGLSDVSGPVVELPVLYRP
jgi:hypothetical protein